MAIIVPDLGVRRRSPELMDAPGLDPAEHRRALEALRRVNGFSRCVAALWPRIRAACRAKGGPARLLDVACGGGDFAVGVAALARREGVPLEVWGCDRSAFATSHAAARARRAGVDARFFEHDALAGPPPGRYDVATCSLFLHHLDGPEAVALLATLRGAADLVLVDDLERGRLGWLLAYAGIRVLSRSRVAHVDGPLSVEGAFTREEAVALAREAGWARPEAVPRFPCRFLLTEAR